MLASEITLAHVGKTLQSLVYPNKNKTARNRGTRQYEVESIYVHRNGNILINSDYYLHMDTEVREVI